MSRRKKVKTSEPKLGAVGYSLWTSPPETWELPFSRSPIPENLDALVSELNLVLDENDPDLEPFRTPVTADDLRSPTQS